MKLRVQLLLSFGLLGLVACSESSVDSALNGDGPSNKLASTPAETEVETEAETAGKPAVKPRWVTLAEVQGESDKRSKSFKVNSPEWQIAWDTKPGKKDAEFFIFLYEEGNENDPIIITTSPGSDLAEMEPAPGEYVVEVRAKQPYSISVKEYR